MTPFDCYFVSMDSELIYLQTPDGCLSNVSATTRHRFLQNAIP